MCPLLTAHCRIGCCRIWKCDLISLVECSVGHLCDACILSFDVGDGGYVDLRNYILFRVCASLRVAVHTLSHVQMELEGRTLAAVDALPVSIFVPGTTLLIACGPLAIHDSSLAFGIDDNLGTADALH